MNLKKLIQELPEMLQGEVKLNEPMKDHTSWHIGGPADVMVLPRNTEDIQNTVKLCREHDIPWWVLGNGSNILVLDAGIRGVVIKLRGVFNKCCWHDTGVETQSGMQLPKLAREALDHGFGGLEWSVGIPATVGGAVVMNAGVGDMALGNFVTKVEAVSETGIIRYLSPGEMAFGYRCSILQQKQWIVTRVFLSLPTDNGERSRQQITDHIKKRSIKQPLEYPNAGSVFKNPQGDYAGRLLDMVGAKGLRYGDAQVSQKHANFIVNLGGARAAEVLRLIEELQILVWKKFHIELELEIKIMGEQ